MNIMTTLIYWTLLAPAKFSNPKSYEDAAAIFDLFMTFLNHTFPIISTILNLYLLSDVVSYLSDIWIPFAVGCVYILVNYSWVTTTGRPIYGFMDWKTDISSYLSAGILLLAISF